MDRIEINPVVCNGRPVVKGTRVSVQSILEYLAAGDTPEEILAAFPQLKPEDIAACLRFSAQVLQKVAV